MLTGQGHHIHTTLLQLLKRLRAPVSMQIQHATPASTRPTVRGEVQVWNICELTFNFPPHKINQIIWIKLNIVGNCSSPGWYVPLIKRVQKKLHSFPLYCIRCPSIHCKGNGNCSCNIPPLSRVFLVYYIFMYSLLTRGYIISYLILLLLFCSCNINLVRDMCIDINFIIIYMYEFYT